MKLTTTLNAIRSHNPCAFGWGKILKYLGKTQEDDEPVNILTVLESNGLEDTLLTLRCWPEHDNTWRLYAVWCASRVGHLLTDERSRNALVVAEKHARGTASNEELDAASTAAWYAAWDAAWESASAAASDAARESASAAAWYAANDAARDAAWDAAWYAARDAQKMEFVRVIEALESGVDPYPETIYTPSNGKEVAK